MKHLSFLDAKLVWTFEKFSLWTIHICSCSCNDLLFLGACLLGITKVWYFLCFWALPGGIPGLQVGVLLYFVEIIVGFKSLGIVLYFLKV